MTVVQKIAATSLSIVAIGLLLWMSPRDECENVKGGVVELFSPSLMCR